MKKINIDKINMTFYSDKYIYVVSLINEEVVIKRIDVVNNKNIIIINLNNLSIKSYPIISNNIELYNILKDIVINLRKYHMVNDVLDIDKVESILKYNYKKKMSKNNSL